MSEETKENSVETLVDLGRELGGSLLADAVRTAESSDHLTNQVFVMRRAAIHILATELFNLHNQAQVDPNSYLVSLNEDLEKEFDFLGSEEMEFTGIGQYKQ